jgi:TRAP-type mannitol/chloroaromatic compound transport system permease small subunit
MALFLAAGLEATWISYAIDERSADTSWFPPLWPLKAVVPACALLLILQGVSEFLKGLHAWKH